MSSIYEEDLETRLLRFATSEGDATIVAYIRAGRASADPITVTLERLVYALHKEKQQYFEMAKKTIESQPNQDRSNTK